MSKVITKSQMKEIEYLGKNHADSLIAYGADMYRKGLVHGVVYLTVGFVIGYSIIKVRDIVRHTDNE